MTENEHIVFSLFRAFECVLFRRSGPKEYRLFGEPPEFYRTIFPQAEVDAGQTCAPPWESSYMLEFFLEEAEAFFASGQLGCISSGVWEEDGLPMGNAALIAKAVSLPTAQIFIIRLLKDGYREQSSLLQRMREQLLESRTLSQHLATFKEKSRMDGLTWVFNRTTFQELLLDEIKRSHILGYPLTLLMLDIDDFKKVNDTFGHLAGDAVLRAAGETLKNTLRRNDITARYGGEEFVVLIPHASPEQTAQVAEKLRENIAAMTVPGVPGVTVSIGCTVYRPGENTETFFGRADEALYAAKRSGKNRVCVQ